MQGAIPLLMAEVKWFRDSTWWVVKKDGTVNQSAVEQLKKSLGWNGDALAAAAKKPVNYVVGKEGGEFWVDSYVIPVGAKNPDAALAVAALLLSWAAARTVPGLLQLILFKPRLYCS